MAIARIIHSKIIRVPVKARSFFYTFLFLISSLSLCVCLVLFFYLWLVISMKASSSRWIENSSRAASFPENFNERLNPFRWPFAGWSDGAVFLFIRLKYSRAIVPIQMRLGTTMKGKKFSRVSPMSGQNRKSSRRTYFSFLPRIPTIRIRSRARGMIEIVVLIFVRFSLEYKFFVVYKLLIAKDK